MNGAKALIETLANCGVEVCFANPGTSEMHLVQALDSVPEMRSILSLFEGVCTGAADGYARMTGKPAATLLHLGPGLANGIANLHNSRRARSPIINIVGNHPNFHTGLDAPLTSDIDTLARNYSSWIKTDSTSTTLAQDGANAFTASLRQTSGSAGQISTLIMGADAAWEKSAGIAKPNAFPQRAKVENCDVEAAAAAFNNKGKVMLLVEHHATSPEALIIASKISAHTGCRIVTGTFPARVEGGPNAPAIERLPYFPEQVLAMLSEVDQLILVGAQVPASFFAYQATPGLLVPENCTVSRLCRVEDDAIDALSKLASRLGASETSPILFEKKEIPKPAGGLNTKTVIQAVAATMPENLIVATDSGGGNAAYAYCQNSAPVSWLALTGGAIGQGSPVATGAAIACPDRPVLALLGDGGAAYTIQSLWTQARENLNVVTLIFANNSYNILNVEYSRLGVTEVGEVAASLFDMSNPKIDWVAIAKGFGIEGAYADTSEELCELLENAYENNGPFLIQANIKDRQP